MKIIIIFLTIFFFALSVYAADPMVKFYLNDGSTKQYNISDIDTIGIIKSQSNYVMKIFYQDTLVAYYPTEVITKIQFEKDSLKNQILNVYICGYPKTYSLFYIDSIYFYTDIYQPLTIGSQVWMLKNLNVDHYRNGDSIPEIRDSTQWIKLKTGAWCYYYNSDSLGKIYGKIYNWYAVNDPRGLAPKRWHVGSNSEWSSLIYNLGGENIAGGKLNTYVTNESGFSAISGGWRGINFGQFGGLGYTIIWWTSTEVDLRSAFARELFIENSISNAEANGFKNAGSYVRCEKDY